MIFLKIGIRDRGCIFHEYDDGCIRDSRNHRKGEDAERMECLKFYPWACREQRHDCHRRMECYLYYTVEYILRRHTLPFLLCLNNSDIQWRDWTIKTILIIHFIKRRKKYGNF